MKSSIRILSLAACTIGLASAVTLRVQGSAVTITPASPSVLAGSTLTLTQTGAVTPVSISAGSWHTCVLYSDQSIRCTGLNNQGEIGNNSYISVSEPALAIGTVNPATLLTGSEHTCTFVGDGRMQCWGTNYTGQLGDGTIGGFAMVPQFVHNIAGAIKGFVGGFHTCAMMPDRTLQCWGRNQDGQLGNGDSTTDVTLPAPDLNLGPVSTLAAGGYHNCALMLDSSVMCWGRNGRGQVGDGTDVSPVTQPHLVNGLQAVSLSLGGYHSCALLADGTVQCWGQNDAFQTGNSAPLSKVPVTVAGVSNVVALDSGFRHTCATRADGTIWCWGMNDWGQLGDRTTTSSYTPVMVQGIANPRQVDGGWGHTCALLRDNSVWCWGENDFGELGNGTTVHSAVPVMMHRTGLTWTSDNPAVATVNSVGEVTGVSRGTATISVADPFGNTGSVTVTVRDMLPLGLIRQGDGGGTVTSAPAGINCPSACSATFLSDSQVVLTAAPRAVDSVFTGWTGCDSVSGATCTVTMANAKSVTAIFMLKRFTLAVTKSGIGKGTVTSSPAGVSCGTACSSDFVINTTVTLTAAPALGSIFTGWTGCDAVNGSTCTVLVTNNKSVSASFLGIPLP